MHELTFQNSIGFNEFVYLIILRFYKIQQLFFFSPYKIYFRLFFSLLAYNLWTETKRIE